VNTVKTGVKEKAEHVILKDVYNHCILCEVERWGSGSRAGVESNGHTGNRIQGKEIKVFDENIPGFSPFN